MATAPLSGTNIRFLSGVPFSNDYKHTRWFDSLSQQTSYFLAKPTVHTMSESKYQRVEGKNFIRVNKPLDDLWGTNYMMFQNAQYNTEWFYAFVTKLEYVNSGATDVHFEIDVFQTWKFDMNFKSSYVVREHCQLWNTDGTPVINTVDEGLNYGTDYEIVDTAHYEPKFLVYFLVIIAKSTLHQMEGDPAANYIHASLNGTPQPLSYYVHPLYLDIDIPLGATIDGTNYSLSSIVNMLTNIYSQPSAVNNIVSMYITQHIGTDITFDGANTSVVLSANDFEVVNVGSTTTVYVKGRSGYANTEYDCGPKYDGFNVDSESKLLMHPYAITVLDDYKGNRIVLKNEYIDSDRLYINIFGSIGLSNKVSYNPRDYLTQNVFGFQEKAKLSIENALIDAQPHDVSVITDMLAAFLQGNRNSMMNQANSIAFNGITDMVGSAIGGVGSALTGNVMGVASSGMNVVKGGGNAVLQLQGMQAKIKDINNQPPSLSKMGSNIAFDYGNGYTGFYVIKKQIKAEYRKKIGDFFKLYGYKVNELKIPNFHTRQNWNFVQTNSCSITANINNDDLQELKNIFDNGITLWHTDDIGNYSLGNEVI